MFTIGKTYTKNDIYKILDVPTQRRKGAWDTGYREYNGDIFIFSNVGVPGRTGHNYNNYWDGELFVWQGKTNSDINQGLIMKMLKTEQKQNNFLFTRINDKDPFTFEGSVIVKEVKNTKPVSLIWQLKESYYYPLEEIAHSHTEITSTFREGAVKQVMINRYERNPVARRICLKHYGAFCQICSFDFYRVYGEIGKDFIHVHHTVPLSQIHEEYKLNPIKDLIPVCPNCHSMIHRKKDPLSAETLKQIMKVQFMAGITQ